MKYKPGPCGTWSWTDYTIHVAQGERTLCKNGRPDGPADGSLSPRGWRYVMDGAPDQISCKLCLHLMKRDAVETTLSAAVSVERQVSPLAPHWMTRLRQATSLRQAHQCLAFACASCLTDEEVSTYQSSGLFTREQCLRLLRLFYASGQRFDRTLLVRTLMRSCARSASTQLRAWVESDEGQRIWQAKENLFCLERICYALDHTQVFIYGLLICPHFFTILSTLDQETFTRLADRYLALAQAGLCFWWDGSHLAVCQPISFFIRLGMTMPPHLRGSEQRTHATSPM